MKSLHAFQLFGALALVMLAYPSSAFGQYTQATLQSNAAASSVDTEWLAFDKALEKAEKRAKKVLIFVDAPWCGWCKKMDTSFFKNPGYKQTLDAHFVATRLAIADRETMFTYKNRRLSAADLCELFGATQTPATVFLDSFGAVITIFPSYAEPEFYDRLLTYIGTEAYKSMSFEEFTDGD